MATKRTATTEEVEIHRRMKSWTNAVRAKDIDALMSHYADDLLVFDLAPPLAYKGRTSYRKNWLDWFPSFQGPVGYEIRGLSTTTGGDIAFCHSVNRISGTRISGETSDTWVRATIGLRRIGGKWMITHEHFSVPINMETLKGVLDLKP